MKRLFTTTALAASMAFATAAYAAEDDAKNAPMEVTPAQQQDAQPSLETPGEMLSDATATADDDVLAMRDNFAVMSGNAISAADVVGAAVVGPDGKEIGTVDDLVFNEDKSIDQVIIADGKMFGFGGKNVAIDFEGASITRDQNDERMVRIGMTDQALEEVAEFDKAPLEESGGKLATSYIGRDVALATEDDGTGELSDLILDRNGTAKYAVVEYGGMLEMNENRVAIDLNSFKPAPAGEPLNLAMTLDQLREQPSFFYSEEETPKDGEM
ncbi:PRC-barrel domain-containing protein [Parvibaculum sp.]|jgi:sporulation protein YlmC with PRC-barrel domain|uniref:PRC-barrel domain-containing protein n=1 Tax=Parvibaculum sp. TaxID=2024848 RepID=UPI003299C811